MPTAELIWDNDIAEKWKNCSNPYKGIMIYERTKCMISYVRFCIEELPEDAKVKGFDDYVKIDSYQFGSTFEPISDEYRSGGYAIKTETYHARENFEGFFKVLCDFLKLEDDATIMVLGIYTTDDQVKFKFPDDVEGGE